MLESTASKARTTSRSERSVALMRALLVTFLLALSDCEAYTRDVLTVLPSPSTAAVSPAPQQTRRRRLPSPAEQARRRAWGREWGNVGAEWKRAHPAKGV